MVSIAIPASCVSPKSCKDLLSATYTLYQISRACVLLGVEEIIIYDPSKPDEDPAPAPEAPKKIKLDLEEPKASPSSTSAKNALNPGLIFAANMLQYLITPKHLRKLLFKPTGNLAQFKYADRLDKIPGLMDSKHIAQGIAVPRERIKRKNGQKKLSKKERKESGQTPYINLGFDRLFKLRDEALVPTNSRVFVNFKSGKVIDESSPELAKEGSRGYSVRAVTHFSHIFTQSPLKDGYSQTVYAPCQQFKSKKLGNPLIQQVTLSQVQNKGLLIVFGTWEEVQDAVNSDADLELDDAAAIFDGISLGCERARLEDAVMVALART